MEKIDERIAAKWVDHCANGIEMAADRVSTHPDPVARMYAALGAVMEKVGRRMCEIRKEQRAG